MMIELLESSMTGCVSGCPSLPLLLTHVPTPSLPPSFCLSLLSLALSPTPFPKHSSRRWIGEGEGGWFSGQVTGATGGSMSRCHMPPASRSLLTSRECVNLLSCHGVPVTIARAYTHSLSLSLSLSLCPLPSSTRQACPSSPVFRWSTSRSPRAARVHASRKLRQ